MQILVSSFGNEILVGLQSKHNKDLYSIPDTVPSIISIDVVNSSEKIAQLEKGVISEEKEKRSSARFLLYPSVLWFFNRLMFYDVVFLSKNLMFFEEPLLPTLVE